MALAPVNRPFHLQNGDDEDDILEDEEFEDEEDDEGKDEKDEKDEEEDEDDGNGDGETWYVVMLVRRNLTSVTEVPTLAASCLKILGSS